MRKLLVVAMIAVLGVACGGDDEPAADGGGSAGDGESATTVTAANFSFDPAELTVASGDAIEFVNEDDASHSFTVDGTDLEEVLEGSGSVDMAIDLDAGDYDFFCKFHRDTMTGTLTVE